MPLRSFYMNFFYMTTSVVVMPQLEEGGFKTLKKKLTGSCKLQLKYAEEDIWRAGAQAPRGRWGGAEIIFGEGQRVLVKSRMTFYVC